MVYGYARVSTNMQSRSGNSLEVQEKALKEAGAEEIYYDAYTGTKLERKQFNILIDKLKSNDTLIVTKLDRFARSLSDASNLITSLIDRGVIVNVLNLGILSNNSASTLIRNIFLSFAQFERDLIVERTLEGKAIARQNPNFREGRPKKFNSDKLGLALELLENHSYYQVERMTGISKSTLWRYKRKQLIDETAK